MATTNKTPSKAPSTSDNDLKKGNPTSLHVGFWKPSKNSAWQLFPKTFQDEKQTRETMKRKVTAEVIKVVKVDLK